MSAFGDVELRRPGESLGLYCGNANPLLAARIARYLGSELGSSEVQLLEAALLPPALVRSAARRRRGHREFDGHCGRW